ncbi:hypothetical protein K461DRAFT_149590 [Myriangium duriaei CBS 260.36]|uniref:Secreted protein n=1 Tax=Myriangium duriaei CBS 260.36 TaxID=1168546 RepID=A0A9P4J1W1_9PEZI|nr:hypothetical protein K461DRAFT_149590 [Myriangium duriaei CBS 260.36]
MDLGNGATRFVSRGLVARLVLFLFACQSNACALTWTQIKQNAWSCVLSCTPPWTESSTRVTLLRRRRRGGDSPPCSVGLPACGSRQRILQTLYSSKGKTGMGWVKNLACHCIAVQSGYLSRCHHRSSLDWTGLAVS